MTVPGSALHEDTLTAAIRFFSGDMVMPCTMAHETTKSVLMAVTGNGRCTGREIARKAGVSCADTIDALLFLEQFGLVIQLNGYWMVAAGMPGGCLRTPEPPARTLRRRNRAA